MDFGKGFGEHSPGFLEIVISKNSLRDKQSKKMGSPTFFGAFKRFLPRRRSLGEEGRRSAAVDTSCVTGG